MWILDCHVSTGLYKYTLLKVCKIGTDSHQQCQVKNVESQCTSITKVPGPRVRMKQQFQRHLRQIQNVLQIYALKNNQHVLSYSQFFEIKNFWKHKNTPAWIHRILNFSSHALQLLKRTETAITKNRFSIYWMTSHVCIKVITKMPTTQPYIYYVIQSYMFQA